MILVFEMQKVRIHRLLVTLGTKSGTRKAKAWQKRRRGEGDVGDLFLVKRGQGVRQLVIFLQIQTGARGGVDNKGLMTAAITQNDNW